MNPNEEDAITKDKYVDYDRIRESVMSNKLSIQGVRAIRNSYNDNVYA